MKLLSFLLAFACLSSYSQSPMFIDSHGDPINYRFDEEMSVMATGCCCDYSFKTLSTSPPTTPANATRFQLTADSLFINVLSIGAQNFDTVFFQLNHRKGSRIRFTYQTNAVVFADVEIEAGTGVDMGSWWKFAVNYFDHPVSAFVADKPFCVEWTYGTNAATPDGFIPWTGGSMLVGDLEIDNGIGFYSQSGVQDCFQTFSPGAINFGVNDLTDFCGFGLTPSLNSIGNYGAISNTTLSTSVSDITIQSYDAVNIVDATLVISPSSVILSMSDPANSGFEYATNPNNVSDQTLIPYGFIKPQHGNGPPTSTPAYEGLFYVDDLILPPAVYYSVGTSSASDWVLLN